MEWSDDDDIYDDEEFDSLIDEAEGFMLERSTEYNKTCSLCGKMYLQSTEEQKPGFRMKDYDICPYCQGNNGYSMSVEFYNRKCTAGEGM